MKGPSHGTAFVSHLMRTSRRAEEVILGPMRGESLMTTEVERVRCADRGFGAVCVNGVVSAVLIW